MSSFWKPNKKPLYAPMLASFGGGSSRGYGLGSSLGVVDYGYFGAEYSGWDGSEIIFSPSTASTYDGNANTVYDGLDTFIDHHNGRIWSGYNSVNYVPWSNAGNSYTGSAVFYSVDTAQEVELSGHAGSGIGSNGRGTTIAYLNDAQRTPVFVVGHSSSNVGQGAYFFRVSDGAYLGNADFTDQGVMNNADDAGLCWDGTYLLRMNRTDSAIWAYEMPSSTSISGSLNNIYKWSAPGSVQYGMAFAGFTSSGQRRVIYTNQQPSPSGATEVLLDAPSSPTGYTLGHALIGSGDRYTLGSGTTNYSLAIDYLNKNIIVGGYNNSKYVVYTQ